MRAQFGAILDDGLVWRGKCLPMRPGKGSFPGVTCSPEAKPAPFGAAGKTVDQYRRSPCRERSSGLYASWNRRVKTEIPVKTIIERGFCKPGDAENRLGDFVGKC